MAIDTTYIQGFNIRQDGNAQITTGHSLELAAGASIILDDTTLRASTTVVVPLTGGVDTGGGLGSWQNLTGATIIIDRLIIDTVTGASASCTIEAGPTAVSATTANGSLIAAASIHTSASITDNLTATTGIASLALLSNNGWVTFSTDTGASAGFAGNAYISYKVA